MYTNRNESEKKREKIKCGEKRKKIKANKQTNHTECYNQPILDIIMYRTRLLLLELL